MEQKKWNVVYADHDGSAKLTEATTEISESGSFEYGNGKSGLLTVGDFVQAYDLRYCVSDGHMAMLKNHFGKALIEVVELMKVEG